MIPACSHAIVDEAHQLEDVATQYFGFSVSNYRVEELARDVERLAGSRAASPIAGRRDRDRQGGRAACATTRRAFFTELAFAHRARRTRLRGEERVRATDDVAVPRRASAAADLSGALDLVEVDAWRC